MKHSATKGLLKIISKYINPDNLLYDIKSSEWHHRNQVSDKLTIDEDFGVRIQVFSDEIIIYFFGDHFHFEDYTDPIASDMSNYFERATEFLKNIFTCTISLHKKYSGEKLISEKYVLKHPDGKKSNLTGVYIENLSLYINPFVKKHTKSRSWKFDKMQKCFKKV